MLAQKTDKKINLLPQEEFSASTLGRVLVWLLSSFRLIVILTEVIVMLAFLSRFWFDAKANDLNDAIRQKQAIIAASSEFENQFRDIQKRLTVFSAMTQEDSPVTNNLTKVTSYLPTDVSLTSISVFPTYLETKGISVNEASIAQFVANIGADKNFDKIALNGIGINPLDKTSITFSVKSTFLKGAKK